MYRSKSNFNNVMQALAGAFLLALIVAGVLGITRVYAARSTSNATEMASFGDSNSCAAGIQASDFYLRQEQAILSKVIQSNWNAIEMASLSSSNSCAVGVQSSDYYLRQEEAILSKATSSNWTSEIPSLGDSTAGMQSSDYYLRQEESVLSIATQSNWNASEIASLSGSISTAQASH